MLDNAHHHLGFLWDTYGYAFRGIIRVIIAPMPWTLGMGEKHGSAIRDKDTETKGKLLCDV